MEEKIASGDQPNTEAKPTILYHGSGDRRIEEFHPEKGRHQSRNEPPYVFATPKKELAIAFARSKSSPVIIGPLENNQTWFIAISDKEAFLQSDHGGAVYHLPPDTFIHNPQTKLGTSEYISAQPVKPIYKEEYDSTLDALLQAGVQVYFLDEKTYDDLGHSKDGGYSILSGLESENLKRGINPKHLEQKRDTYS